MTTSSQSDNPAPSPEPRRTRVLWAVWTAAIVLAAGLGWVISDLLVPGGGTLVSKMEQVATPAIGGPFNLVDGDGKPVSNADFRGKLMLIYFGYTHCPDACPTALQDMADALDKVGPDAAQQIAPIFITIDPERDTVGYIKGYAEQFDPRLVGLTGSADQVAAAARAYRVYFRKSTQDADYLMDHSSIIYLMGRDGKFLGHFTHQTSPEQMAAAIKKSLG
jgi:cytochrome oxidase Cu insertion factor (SCO1/SenC/PrrC family)